MIMPVFLRDDKHVLRSPSPFFAARPSPSVASTVKFFCGDSEDSRSVRNFRIEKYYSCARRASNYVKLASQIKRASRQRSLSAPVRLRPTTVFGIRRSPVGTRSLPLLLPIRPDS